MWADEARAFAEIPSEPRRSMLGGVALMAFGLASTVVGVRLILTRPRPASLGGMVLAPAGWAALLCGVALAFGR